MKYKNRHRETRELHNAVVEGAKETDESLDKPWQTIETEHGPSSVHVSVTVGHSQDYGKNSFRVSVESGASCGQDPASREEAYQVTKSFCLDKARSLRSEVYETFFKKEPRGTE